MLKFCCWCGKKHEEGECEELDELFESEDGQKIINNFINKVKQ